MNQEEIENTLHREGLKLASVSKRATAFFIDELLLSLILVVAMWNSFEGASDYNELINISQNFTLYYIFIKIVYQAFFTAKYGASLGKIFMHIRVIELKTLSNPSLPASFNRAVFRIISEMMFYLGFIWGMVNPTKQTWHDLTAKTLVIES